MKKYIKCKACGLILEKSKLKGTCPACGVPGAAFEEFKIPVNENRFKILNLHIHPITVHFPQALSILLFVLLITHFLFQTLFPAEVAGTIKIISVLIPLATIPAFITGIIDGKSRLKSLKTKYLSLKIIFGLILIVMSLLLAFILVIKGFDTLYIPSIVISAVCVLCNILLGEIGGKLLCVLFP